MLYLMFSLENYRIHKKRLKQLKLKTKQDKELDELIDDVTKPIIKHILPRMKIKNLDELEMDLKMAKWDRYFRPKQYIAFRLLLRGIGIVVFFVLNTQSTMFALIWFVALFFGLDFLLRNSISNRKNRLFRDLPNFIRVTEGYLLANFPFPLAVQHAIAYVGEEWRPILRKFVVDCEVKGIDRALDELKNEVDLFEMKEFVALVRLTLDQGGDVKQGFSEQAEKVRQMINDLMALKIGQRQVMAMLLQAPLLLCVFLVVGLPTVSSMLNMNTM